MLHHVAPEAPATRNTRVSVPHVPGIKASPAEKEEQNPNLAEAQQLMMEKAKHTVLSQFEGVAVQLC